MRFRSKKCSTGNRKVGYAKGPYDPSPQTFALRARTSHGKTWATLWLRDSEKCPPAITVPDPEPLDNRGWAFPERLLSRRIIEFTTPGTIFERYMFRAGQYSGPLSSLAECVWISGPPSNDRSDFKDILSRRELTAVHPNYTIDPRHSTLELVNVSSMWTSLVTTYSRRQLTYTIDRIFAISGIAERMDSLISDRYCAGLWRSQMPKHLTWYTVPRDIRRPPAQYQGPSWSWVSINSKVEFAQWVTATMEIVSMDLCLRNDSAPFGAVTAAQLTVRPQRSKLFI